MRAGKRKKYDNTAKLKKVETPNETEVEPPKIVEEAPAETYIYTEVVANRIYKLDDSGYLVKKPLPPEDYEFERYDSKMLA